MRRTAPVLLACLLLSCADQERNEEKVAEPGPDRASQSVEAAQSKTAAKGGTSVMRPSVAAEAEPPAPLPLDPLSATIGFEQGSMALNGEARAALKALLQEPVVAAGGAIIIRGHSDSRGHDGDNLVASAKRADAVFIYLRENGIAEERMSVIALGEGRPVAPNVNPDGSDNPEGRARNRRVEIEVRPPESGPTAEAGKTMTPPAGTGG